MGVRGMAHTSRELAKWVRSSRARSLELIADLSDEQLLGPRLAIVNPLLWEIGHVAWFQERWVLRHACGERPLREEGDRLWDSARVAHPTRWDLPLSSRKETLAYVREVRDRVLNLLAGGDPEPRLRYFVLLSVFHEDMHAEAFAYTRQTFGWPPPCPPAEASESRAVGSSARVGEEDPAPGDASIPGGSFELGASPDEPFVFDNEKWAHRVRLAPFAIARTAVTQQEFLRFVEDRGYSRRELWSAAGWRWRQAEKVEGPLYWRREPDGTWRRRCFDAWIRIESEHPMIHVNWHEAQAYCRWAGRRLPTEAEWELAAAGEPSTEGGGLASWKRRFPWGDAQASPARAHLDWEGGGTASVHAYPGGDSAFGCRQMIGNVWEWTASDFAPYPGFEVDPYREYSQPWFQTRKVLRGGCWATRGRLLRNTWRNFYEPQRRDVWAGFRTCALEPASLVAPRAGSA